MQQVVHAADGELMGWTLEQPDCCGVRQMDAARGVERDDRAGSACEEHVVGQWGGDRTGRSAGSGGGRGHG